MISELTQKTERELISLLKLKDIEGIKKANYAEGFFDQLTLNNYHGCREPFFKYAIQECSPALTKYLISQGCYVDARDEAGYTALHEAVRMGYLENILLLLQASADPNSNSKYGETPLHIAVQYHRYLGKDEKGRDLYGINENDKLCINALLEYGANIRRSNNMGKRPCDTQRTQILELLKKYDVKSLSEEIDQLKKENKLLLSKIEEIQQQIQMQNTLEIHPKSWTAKLF